MELLVSKVADALVHRDLAREAVPHGLRGGLPHVCHATVSGRSLFRVQPSGTFGMQPP